MRWTHGRCYAALLLGKHFTDDVPAIASPRNNRGLWSRPPIQTFSRALTQTFDPDLWNDAISGLVDVWSSDGCVFCGFPALQLFTQPSSLARNFSKAMLPSCQRATVGGPDPDLWSRPLEWCNHWASWCLGDGCVFYGFPALQLFILPSSLAANCRLNSQAALVVKLHGKPVKVQLYSNVCRKCTCARRDVAAIGRLWKATGSSLALRGVCTRVACCRNNRLSVPQPFCRPARQRLATSPPHSQPCWPAICFVGGSSWVAFQQPAARGARESVAVLPPLFAVEYSATRPLGQQCPRSGGVGRRLACGQRPGRLFVALRRATQADAPARPPAWVRLARTSRVYPTGRGHLKVQEVEARVRFHGHHYVYWCLQALTHYEGEPPSDSSESWSESEPESDDSFV